MCVCARTQTHGARGGEASCRAPQGQDQTREIFSFPICGSRRSNFSPPTTTLSQHRRNTVACWPICGCRRSTFPQTKCWQKVEKEYCVRESRKKFSQIDLRLPQVEKSEKLEMTRV